MSTNRVTRVFGSAVFCVTLVLFLINPVAALARAGGGFDGGGGDPLANEFMEITRLIYNVQPWGRDVPIKSSQLREKIEQIRASLEGKRPLVVFPRGETVQCYGQPKLGCVGRDGRIRIAREGWKEASEKDRVEVVAMELIKSLNVENRYQIAEAAAKALVDEPRIRERLKEENLRKPDINSLLIQLEYSCYLRLAIDDPEQDYKGALTKLKTFDSVESERPARLAVKFGPIEGRAWRPDEAFALSRDRTVVMALTVKTDSPSFPSFTVFNEEAPVDKVSILSIDIEGQRSGETYFQKLAGSCDTDPKTNRPDIATEVELICGPKGKLPYEYDFDECKALRASQSE